MARRLDSFPELTIPAERCSIEQPDGQHFCQIHQREQSLVDAIVQFTLHGLRGGEVCVVVAPQARLEKVLAALDARGVDTDETLRTGMLVLDRPADVLDACTVDGVLDESAFRDAFAQTFALGGKKNRMRVYGEVSNQCWHDGDRELAILLERLCIDARGDRNIPVFCAYLLDGLAAEGYPPELEQLCRLHACLPETPDDELLRAAVDTASYEILGIPMSVALTHSTPDAADWQRRLPLARRTVQWLNTNMASAGIRVLRRARYYYR